ncbi:uncharacterized protein LOC128859776 [Anastrepha ludens]|uniref:uncharacterized protein LOC128859776 n=1 Tax=Anastrepha ludens TaxID=28586 RepID=UPI0023B184C4|nr:uncharacterized protein LOC128859776 [Anastrepha ludens]
MMDSVYLKKLLLKSSEADCKRHIYLHNFEEPAAELDIPLNDFRAECKNVLTSDIGLPSFEVELDGEKKILIVNKNDGFCIRYLEVKLTEADKNYEMLDIALNLIATGRVESENQRTNEALSNLVEDVEKVVQEKEEWKQKMLRKFLVVLNTKKEKISILQKKLENMENRMKRTQDVNAEVDGNGSIGERMEQDAEEDSNSDALASCNEQSDFDAPTQRLTPQITRRTDEM